MKNKLLSLIVILPILLCSLIILGGWTSPQLTPSEISVDQLSAKLKKSNNWVLVEQKITKINNIQVSNETCISERNGNVIRRIKTINKLHTYKQQQFVILFRGNQTISYIGTKQKDEKEWNWNSARVTPNPSFGDFKIKDYIEAIIKYEFETTVSQAQVVIRKENGVYYISESEREQFGDSTNKQKGNYNTFNYTLSFGISKLKKPIFNNNTKTLSYEKQKFEVDEHMQREMSTFLRHADIDKICNNINKEIQEKAKRLKRAISCDDRQKIIDEINHLENLIFQHKYYEKHSIRHILKKIIKNF